MHVYLKMTLFLLVSAFRPVDVRSNMNKSKNVGPPFALSVKTYHDLLDRSFDCVFVKECESFPNRAGQEKIGLWKRKA